MEQIEINGLLWDTENLTVDGKTHFTWDEAMDAAKTAGKRLPTKEEYESLLALGWEWAKEKKGISVTNQLFFPAAGFQCDGELYRSGANGYIWSSTPNGSNIYILYFSSTVAYVNIGTHAGGFSVRCVQDIEKQERFEGAPFHNTMR